MTKKERKAAYDAARNAKPEVKERKAELHAEYRTRPDYKQRQAAHNAKWYAKNGKRQRAAYHAERKDKPGVKQRNAEVRRLRKYNLLPVEYNFMLAGQGFRCAACEADEPGGKGEWHVDHCHDTGKVRGILCHGCNVGIGLLGDTAERLRRALAYLERFECKTNNLTKPTSETDGRPKASPPTEPNAKPRPSLRLVSSSQNFVGQSRKSA